MAISEIALKGVMKVPDGFLAIFEGRDGKSYLLQEGDAVLDGKVKRIGRNQVTFEQVILDPFGRPKEKKEIVVNLHM